MNTPFAINFRREAWKRERTRERVRMLHLGLWAFYAGVLGVVLGLYALNLATLAERSAALGRQLGRAHGPTPADLEWRPGAPQTGEIERRLRNPRRWRDRLNRLGSLVPADARMTAIQFNPENVSGNADVVLVLTGRIRPGSGQDRMARVLEFVHTLSRDSLFAGGFHNVRLVTTRAAAEGDAAEFVVECR